MFLANSKLYHKFLTYWKLVFNSAYTKSLQIIRYIVDFQMFSVLNYYKSGDQST